MVRLKDIARHAGVAVMTVSKALRDAPDVSAATKARIKALAQQMGYVPNSFAQGLRCQTSWIFRAGSIRCRAETWLDSVSSRACCSSARG